MEEERRSLVGCAILLVCFWTLSTSTKLFFASPAIFYVQFASWHPGSTMWLQWLTVFTMVSFLLVFDLAFTNDSNFLFDPDAENWRRKMVRSYMYHFTFLRVVNTDTWMR
jgi:hypothetical protein